MPRLADAATTAVCLKCGREIRIRFAWEAGDPEVGVFPGWIPGIAIEDEACADHMTWAQRQAIEDAALVDAPAHDPEGATAHGG